MAKLHFIYSVMNSGKSLRLLSTAHDFDEKNIPILVIKPSIDTRDGVDIIKSRAGLEGIKWVLVDECQFLTEEQVDQLSDIVDFLNINVICYGLRTDFKSKLFPASKRLLELADGIEEIKSSCQCGNKASINARFNSEGKIITEGNQILVGGDDLYHAMCRKCWKKIIMEK